MSGWLGSTGQKSTASHEEPLPSKSYCLLIRSTAEGGIATNRCDGYRLDRVEIEIRPHGWCHWPEDFKLLRIAFAMLLPFVWVGWVWAEPYQFNDPYGVLLKRQSEVAVKILFTTS
jgi:hypothetical protein